MRHTGNGRHQVTPEFQADVRMWCAANKRIADWLAQYDYPDSGTSGRGTLRLVPAPPVRAAAHLTPQHARASRWRSLTARYYRLAPWQRVLFTAFLVHPGFVWP